MSQRIRVIAQQQDEVDVDRLVFALLRLVEQIRASEAGTQPKPAPSTGERETAA